MNSSDKHDYKTGDRIEYMSLFDKPEPGTVTSVNDMYVFVRFDEYSAQHCTSQACDPSDLRKGNL